MTVEQYFLSNGKQCADCPYYVPPPPARMNAEPMAYCGVLDRNLNPSECLGMQQ